VQHPDGLAIEIPRPSEGVDEDGPALRRDSKRHRVDREVAPGEVPAERSGCDARERAASLIGFCARRSDVQARPVVKLERHGAEALVRARPGAQTPRERPAQRDSIPLDGKIDVADGPVEKQVPHGSSHQIQRQALFDGQPAGRLDPPAQLRREQAQVRRLRKIRPCS